MQLINLKNRKLASLTISSSLVASSFAYSYNTLDNFSIENVITTAETDNFVQSMQENTYVNLSLSIEFERLLNAWKSNTMFMSFSDQIVGDENFKKIVSYGEAIVPLILEEISLNPSPLVWALNFIYNKKISENKHTTIEEACKLWVRSIQ